MLRIAAFFAVLMSGPVAALPVVNVSPSCGGGVPAPCFSTIQEAVNNAGGAPATVNVYPGTYAESVNISLMGSVSGPANDLVIRGVSASGAPTSGEATVTGSAGGGSLGEAFYNAVDPFPFALTLQGLNVTSADTDAVDIEGISGDVNLIDMAASNAAFDGFDIRAGGNVTIVGSSSNSNGNDGFELFLANPGDLTITDTEALDNGTVLSKGEASSEPPFSATGGDDGFQIQIDDGTVSFTDVRANGNGESGIELSPSFPNSALRLMRFERVEAVANGYNGIMGKPNVKVANSFSGGFGFLADLTLLDTEARDNGHDGIEFTGLNVDGAQVLFRNVTSTGNGNLFTVTPGWGQGDGILINTANFGGLLNEVGFRSIVFENVTTTDNGEGIELHACCEDEGRIGDVTLRNITSERNLNHGLTLRMSGDLVMESVQLNDNGIDECIVFPGDDSLNPVAEFCPKADGLDMAANDQFDRPTSVLMTDVTANNNVGDGLQVHARGPITLRNIVASNNGQRAPDSGNDDFGRPIFGGANDRADGLMIETSVQRDDRFDSITEITDVTIEGCTLNNNTDDGSDITVNGQVSMTDCEALGNGEDGIDVSDTNSAENFNVSQQQSEPLVVATDRSLYTASAVTLQGISAVGNGDDGLDISAFGTVTLGDVCSSDHSEASERSGDGIVIKQAGALVMSESTTIRNRRGLALRDVAGGAFSITISDLAGNLIAGISNYLNDTSVAASGNWWGAASGPTHPGNAGGGGDVVQDGTNAAIGIVAYAGFTGAPQGVSICPERNLSASTDGPPTRPLGPMVPVPIMNAPAVLLLVMLLGLAGLFGAARLRP